MKYANTALLVMTSALNTVALAHDGNGHGPPKKSTGRLPVTTADDSLRPGGQLW